jgi:hypothetical protein
MGAPQHILPAALEVLRRRMELDVVVERIATPGEALKGSPLSHARKSCPIQAGKMLNEYVDWPGIQQVHRLERHIRWLRQGGIYKAGHEVEYGITSLARQKASSRKLLAVRRCHWSVEVFALLLA